MWKVRQFLGLDEFEDMVNGAIKTGALPANEVTKKYFGLHGKTLIFTTPAATTITFSDATNAGLDLAAICTQLQTGAVLTTKLRQQNRISIYNATDGQPVVLASTGTANTLFGFSATVATTGKVFAGPAGTKPRWMTLDSSAGLDRYVAVTEE